MADSLQGKSPVNVTESQAARSRNRQELYVASAREIWAHRWLILGVSMAIAVITLLINFFLLWPFFKSTAILLPEPDRGKLASLGQIANLAEIAGVGGLGASSSNKLYPEILSSETVLRPVILRKYENERYGHPVDLIEYFKVEGATQEDTMEKMLKLMRGLITTSVDARTGVVSVSAEMPEPRLSADVVNDVVGELDDFIRHRQNTSASEQARWVGSRLDSVGKDLRRAEDALRDFRERNKIVSSPDLVLQQERLMRNVQMASTLFVELKKQFELAKIDEVKSLTVVSVLDKGDVPSRKVRPKRATNAGIGFCVSIAVICLFYAMKPVYLARKKEIVGIFTST